MDGDTDDAAVQEQLSELAAEEGASGSDAARSSPEARDARQKRRSTSTRASRKSGAAPKRDEGGDLERRVARVEFAEGAFVRLRVPVRLEYAEAGRDVLTDIDVLSCDIDARLRRTLSMLECKSGAGESGEPDRLFWLAGFKQYVGFDRAGLVRTTVSRRGRRIARQLELEILDAGVLQAREAANAWLPEEFAHVGGRACLDAEARTDAQLKRIQELPTNLVKFLRHEAVISDSHRVLSALTALGAVFPKTGQLPDPAAAVIGGHALVDLLAAGLSDASRLESIRPGELGQRLSKAITTGSPDDESVLQVLDDATALMRHIAERIHAQYHESGAARQDYDVPDLRSLIDTPPGWIDEYIDLVRRLRGNPSVSREVLQSAELACFDALLGGSAWTADAFSHLFTPEHQQLLLLAVRVLESIAGKGVAYPLRELAAIPFDRSRPAFPDRRVPRETDHEIELLDSSGSDGWNSATHS